MFTSNLKWLHIVRLHEHTRAAMPFIEFNSCDVAVFHHYNMGDAPRPLDAGRASSCLVEGHHVVGGGRDLMRAGGVSLKLS